VPPLALFLGLALVVAQFALPRRFAFLPLLIAVCHLPYLPIIEAGVGLSSVRLLILAGLIRALSKGQCRLSSHPLDVLMLAWACWTVLSTLGHNPPDCNPLTIRLALASDLFGAYLYTRSYLRDYGDFLRFSKCLAIVLIPLALFMFAEQVTGRNLYDVVGGFAPEVRSGRVRAHGSFGHAILAGTAGATSLPLVLLLRRKQPRLAKAGVVACGLIVMCSGSSTPIASLFFSLGALALWRWRRNIRLIRNCVIAGLFALHIVMNAPVWYLLAKIDLVGGSTGWHRAELIDQALKRLGEWWLIGTDVTRHWMPTGVPWSTYQTDITNYYLWMGVIGGLPLMLLFIAILIKVFQLLGREIRARRRMGDPAEFGLWCIGSALFAHSLLFLTIAYFDQSYVLLCFLIGAVPQLCTGRSSNSLRVPKQSQRVPGIQRSAAPIASGA
jgi:hypothetical protein